MRENAKKKEAELSKQSDVNLLLLLSFVFR